MLREEFISVNTCFKDTMSFKVLKDLLTNYCKVTNVYLSKFFEVCVLILWNHNWHIISYKYQFLFHRCLYDPPPPPHLAFCTDVTSVIGNNSLNFMMIRWLEHGEKGVTDGRTDGQIGNIQPNEHQNIFHLTLAFKILNLTIVEPVFFSF